MRRQIGDLDVSCLVQGSGPPLVLVHGGGADLRSWEEVIPWLSPHFTVYALDLRGHGETRRPPEPRLHADVWTDDLGRFMDSFGLDRAALAGWSLGGVVVLSFAVRHPERVSHVIAIGAPGTQKAAWDRSGFEDRVALARSGLPMEEIVDRTFAFTRAAFSPHTLEKNPEAVDKIRRMLTRNRPEDYAQMLECREDPALLEAQLPKVTCPALVVCGDADGRTPLEMSENLHKALPSSSLEVIPSCGHYYGYEQPEATARAILRFLQAARPS